MPKKTKTNPIKVEFQSFSYIRPAAKSVQLVGDFTNWQERPISLRQDTDGVWRAAVWLTPGTHHYRFLVDGQWSDDPASPLQEPNPFGGQNAVRQVN